MSRRFFALPALAVATGLVGCSGSNGASPGGRLLVHRSTRPGGVILDAPALGRYCASDSTLTVIATGRTWTGGIAVRTALPLQGEQSFRIGRVLDAPGDATAAFRPLGGVARVGVAGTVRMRTSSGHLQGSIEVSVTDSTGPPVLFRGTFARVGYQTMSGRSCGL